MAAILLGITAITLLLYNQNIVVAKVIFFILSDSSCPFHNTHQRHAPICVPAITPMLVPLIAFMEVIAAFWYADTQIAGTPRQWFNQHYVLHLISSYSTSSYTYLILNVYATMRNIILFDWRYLDMSWFKTWNTLVKIGFHHLMVVYWLQCYQVSSAKHQELYRNPLSHFVIVSFNATAKSWQQQYQYQCNWLLPPLFRVQYINTYTWWSPIHIQYYPPFSPLSLLYSYVLKYFVWRWNKWRVFGEK